MTDQPKPLAERYRDFLIRNNLPLTIGGELQAAIMEYLINHPEPPRKPGPTEYK